MLLYRSNDAHRTVQLSRSEKNQFPFNVEDLGIKGSCATSGFWDADFQIEDMQLLRKGKQ